MLAHDPLGLPSQLLRLLELRSQPAGLIHQHRGLLGLRGHESNWDGPRCRWGMAQLALACCQSCWSAALPMSGGVGGDAHGLKLVMVLPRCSPDLVHPEAGGSTGCCALGPAAPRGAAASQQLGGSSRLLQVDRGRGTPNGRGCAASERQRAPDPLEGWGNGCADGRRALRGLRGWGAAEMLLLCLHQSWSRSAPGIGVKCRERPTRSG